MFCPTCQANTMRVGGRTPPGWHCDMYGQISYECRYCKTWGVGPGTSPGLICSYGPSPVNLFMDGNMWCCTRPDFVNLQESLSGFGTSRLNAVKDLIRQENAEGGAT